jgi:hypothetical protein
MKTFLLWLVLGSTWILGLLMVAQAPAFIAPSFSILVFAPCLFCWLAITGVSGAAPSMMRLIGRKLETDDYVTIDRVCATGFLFGGLGAAVGLILVMSRLTQPETIFSGVGLALVAYLYGALPTLVLLPASWGSGPGFRTTAPLDYLRKAAGYATGGVVFLMMTFFLVLYALNKH